MRSNHWRAIAFFLLGNLALASLVTIKVRADELVTRRTWIPFILKAESINATQDIDNPKFEEGYTGWFFSSTQGGGDILTVAPIKRGYHSARLGSDIENFRQAYISQHVTVPVGRTWLTYWHYINSQEDYCPVYTRYDYVSIQVNGNEVYVFSLCDDSEHPNRIWQKQALDLSPYQGMSIYLKIYFESDSTLPTDFYVDDFAFE